MGLKKCAFCNKDENHKGRHDPSSGSNFGFNTSQREKDKVMKNFLPKSSKSKFFKGV